MLYYVDQRGAYTEATYPKPAPRAHPTKPGRSFAATECCSATLFKLQLRTRHPWSLRCYSRPRSPC